VLEYFSGLVTIACFLEVLLSIFNLKNQDAPKALKHPLFEHKLVAIEVKALLEESDEGLLGFAIVSVEWHIEV